VDLNAAVAGIELPRRRIIGESAPIGEVFAGAPGSRG
jgi:hypothetical protein